MMHVKHAFVSAKADGTDATQVKPSNWNDDHVLTTDQTAGMVLGREPGSSGGIEELPISISPQGRTAILGGAGFTLPRGTTLQRPSSPIQGEMRWNTTLNLAELYGPAGWSTLQPGAGYVKIGEQNPVAQSFTEFIGVASTFKHLRLIFDLIASASSINYYMQFYNSGGVIDIGSNYSWLGVGIVSSTLAVGGNGSTASGAIVIGNVVGNSDRFSGSLDIQDIQGAHRTHCDWKESYGTGVDFVSVTGSGSRNVAGPITGLRITPSSGSISGIVTLFGTV